MKKLALLILPLFSMAFAAEVGPSPTDQIKLPGMFQENNFTVSKRVGPNVIVRSTKDDTRGIFMQKHTVVQSRPFNAHTYTNQLKNMEIKDTLPNRILGLSPFNIAQFAIGYADATYSTTKEGKNVTIVPFSAIVRYANAHPKHGPINLGDGKYSASTPVFGLLRIESTDTCWISYGKKYNTEIQCSKSTLVDGQDGYNFIIGNDKDQYYQLKNLLYVMLPEMTKTYMSEIIKHIKLELGDDAKLYARSIPQNIRVQIPELSPLQLKQILKIAVLKGQVDTAELNSIYAEVKSARNDLTNNGQIPLDRAVFVNSIDEVIAKHSPKVN